MASVYILHLSKPLMRGTSRTGKPLMAGHYTGYADDLLSRLFKHYDGKGSRFTRVCFLRGVDMQLARVWEGADRTFERKVKKCRNARRLCPICNPNAMNHLSTENIQ